ncbi:MAG: hypothetical protein NTW87_35570 [Planctomycetota bacterium]|nr:hypothetical protein [Planctomycetota bacterium]
MAMDDTDKRLVKGMIWSVVFGALAYFLPWHLPGLGLAGYKDQKQEERDAHEQLRQSGDKYRRFYGPLHPAYLGDFPFDEPSDPLGQPIAGLKSLYTQSNLDIQNKIEDTKSISRMAFEDWTKVPEKEQRDPGVYFRYMWQLKRNRLASALNLAKVECMDADIGFSKYGGDVRMAENETEEMLRELSIAEKIIGLCVAAKQRQENFEKGSGVQPEAFMRILSVKPEKSVASAPSSLIPNPRYSPEEKNPGSERFRKYLVKPGKPFIQEYPVQIVLQCDINSFMRFLHSVRTPGQFLVIRNLEIFSPFIEDTQVDKTEFKSFQIDTPGDVEKKLHNKMNQEHVLVRMSASGMDFFNPKDFPHGLYDSPKNKAAPADNTRRRLRTLPPATP